MFMDELIVLLALVILFGPITVAIIALVKAAQVRRELHELRSQFQRFISRRPFEADKAPQQQPVPAPTSVLDNEPSVVPQKPVATATPARPSAVTSVPQSNTSRPKSPGGMEFLMGGKAAAFAGIAILVAGIVFLVGYAIQQNWIGPGTRIVLGLLCGGVLVGAGHGVERKDTRLRLLARVLTGGGSALFYFSVFAAYGIYHLIGPVAAGFGLFASALAVFGLAMVYRSQAVAVLGVLGAFITPLLIGADIDDGVFPLVYVAVINVPVLLLGVHRKWQLLYNLAFAFTIIHFLAWLDWFSEREAWIGLGFALLYFAEYAALGLLKLRSEQQVTGRTADMVRLVLTSLLLLGAVYWLLDEANLNDGVGAAFLLLALVHIGLARFAFKVLSRFNAEILCFLGGGLLFATLALPAQLDREWVSLGWAIEGAIVAWFSVRVQSRILQAGAFFLGLIGILKALLYDVSLYHNLPHLFLNARFAVGMLSAGLLGVQGWLANRFPEENANRWRDLLWCTGVISVLLVFFADAFWTLGADDVFCWLVTSIVLLMAGTASLLLAPRTSTVNTLGGVLILLVPIKLVVDAFIGMELTRQVGLPFLNVVIWLQLAMVGLMILFLQPRLAHFSEESYNFGLPLPRLLNLMAVVTGIAIMTIEIMHSRSDWASTAITILWAGSALTLILTGMKRRVAAHRYLGLIVFGLATLKVLIVDASELNGLERVAAFMGTGVLLLALSYAYQKASAYFNAMGEGE